MPEWNQGYVTDVNYVKNVFSELSPASINYCLTLSNQPAADLTKPFTYAELGAGFGLSVASWAAQYPQGRFFSVDFNPSQTAWAQKLADAAGLDNLTVYERSFGQMLSEDLPPLDYIVLHGIYSWVTPEVRADIRNFIAKFLKPGGVVYLGYNAQPGWSAVGPLRNLILEQAAASGERNPIQALGRGLALLKDLEAAGALYFKASGQAKQWLENWGRANPQYVVGELLNREHRAFYFSEILADLAEAKTTFVGSLEVANYLEPIITPKDFLTRLEQAGPNLALRETMKDLLYNTTFRRDLFMKGTQPADRQRSEGLLRQTRLVLCGAQEKLPEKVVLKGADITLKPEIYEAVLNILAEGPVSIGDLESRANLTLPQAAQAATVLLALNLVQPVAPAPVSSERVAKFNLALDDLLGSEVFSAILSVNGAWQACGLMERLFFLSLMKGQDPKTFIRDALAARGWKMRHNDQEVTDPQQLEQLIEEQVNKSNEKLHPIFTRLGLPRA